ncbi:MAG TPA: 2-dehydropantoate 2-reductase [Burkholderiaceae bacterium]
MRVLVVGAGGTGGYYGGRLFQAGRDVSFLVRPARAARLREHGLQIVSPHGDATLRPPLLTADQIASTFDLVLVSVKAYALERAIEDFAPAVGPATMILPVLNGLRHIDRLAERFRPQAVLGGVSQIAATVDDEGRVVQLSEFHRLAYGERTGASVGDGQRLAALDALMSGVGFDNRLSQTIDRDMWSKWVFLASLGAITCLMRGTIGEIEAVAGGAALAHQMLAECSAIAAAHGYAPPPEATAQSTAMLTAKGSGLASSMYRDLNRGLEVEVEQILGDLAARARAKSVECPLLATALAHVQVYQQRVIAAAR